MLVDTDILIRFFTNDDPVKALRFERFLRSERKMAVTAVTVAEIYWVLSSFYRFSKKKILDCLESLVSKPNILCSKLLLLETITILRHHSLSFVDAFIAAYSLSKHHGQVLSYDKGFDKIKLIKRVEP
ncbi:PIN domain-containing protein [Microgenomates group bacterium]|nr:PIN domain-containing protein [Microgenomates group bacterium]